MYLWMGAGLMAMGAAFSVPLQPRLSMRVTLTPTACLVCASVLPAPWVVVCAAVGVSVARLLVRRPRSAWLHKVAHNTSMDIVAAALAAGVMFTAGVRPEVGEPPLTAPSLSHHVLAFLIAAAVVVVFEELVTTAAVTLSTKRPFLVVLRGLWLTRLCVAIAEIGMAGVVTTVTGLDMRVLVALPLVMLAVYLLLKYRLKIAEERRAWERLAALSDALTSRDLDVVLQTAVGGAVDLFVVRAADIEIAAGRRLVRASQTGGVARLVYDGPTADAPEMDQARHAVSYGFGADGDGVHGVLRLYLSGPRDALSVREGSTLRAFAATLSSSLDLAHAYGLLAAEAQQHETAASHDTQTGLLNRAGLLSRLGEGFGSTCHAVVIRLDTHAFLADVVGRDDAVNLLRTIADRLRQASGDMSFVARIGDVTFALVMAGVTTDVAYQRACWTVAALRRGIRLGGRRLVVRATAGMASGAPDAAVIDAAERVLWRASQRGDDRLVSYQMGPVREWTLDRELNSSRLSIAFEPIVDLASGRIAMMQSVPRWLYSRHEVLPADDYVYQLIGNDHGSLETLARTVVGRSLAAATLWRDVLPDTPLVVPIPAGALTQPFVEAVRLQLSEHAASPGRSLVLALSAPPEPSAREAAEWIAQFGVRLLMDQYGSDHVGLATLGAAEWSILRLHPAYALDAGWQPARSVIRAAVDLATDLDLAVIAPGIRTEKERHELVELGCTMGSGPLLGGEMFPSQVRHHALLWQPRALHGGAQVVRLHRARRPASRHGS
ncbi:EAL domain-containing protein [Micromonospora craterilacus]|uniref:EAL domain-containing protein n=1 Tax=Micromonospora craterilacus TaxID=1655439 RepID=UPI001314E83B|nr:EAL domain-containing protein [Micromonospora craterilacus]